MGAVAPVQPSVPREARVEPECPQEPAHFFVRHFTRWSGLALGDVSHAVLACRHYWATLEHFLDFRNDPRMPAVALEKLDKRLARERAKAIRRLEPIIEAGLVARDGERVLPHAATPAQAHRLPADWLAWQTIELCMATLGVEPHGLTVCRSCTVVFRAGNGASAQHCEACAKHARDTPRGRTRRPRRATPLVAGGAYQHA
jgi:hypothetical protein